MGDKNLPADFNKQCQECHVIMNGPADGQQPGHRVGHISASGDLLIPYDQTDAAHPGNVSHGVCEDCAPAFEARYHEWMDRRRAERAAQQSGETTGEEPAV